MIDHRTLQIVFADLQDSIVALSSTNSPETIRRSAGVLAKVAQTLDIPFTVSVAPRPDGPGVIAELPETPRSCAADRAAGTTGHGAKRSPPRPAKHWPSAA